MRFLITGTAGFIGNALALKLLRDGHEVAGVDAITPYYSIRLKRDRLQRLADFDGYTPHEIALEDMDAMADAFAAATPERVIHLAAQAGVRYSLENPRSYVETNVVGSFNVIELCKQHDVGHLILSSTSSAYGANTDYPFRETDRTAFPLTIYAATKQASELIAHSHSHLHGVPTSCVRFFTVYGPWGRPDMAPMLFAKALFAGKPIDVYNHGQMARDFTFIEDLTEALIRLSDAPPIMGQPTEGVTDSLSPVAPYRLVNIGNAEPVPLMAFIREIEAHVGVRAQMNMMAMQPGDVEKTHANSDLLHALTGFRPATPLKTGIKTFINWYREYYGLG
jgi:UDP-glucuronate 4-epimerase